MRPAAALGLTAALAVTLVLGACSSDGDDGGTADATTTTAAAEARPGPGGDAALVGTWTAAADDLLVEALVASGLEDAPDCSGTVTLVVDADGTFRRTTEGRCDFGAEDGTVAIEVTGGYGSTDGALTLTDVTTSGSIVGEGGDELALPDQDLADGGVLRYQLDGDALVVRSGSDEDATPPVTFQRER